MSYDWLVIIPPLIVVILATLTRRVLFSLSMGIVSASLIANNFVPWSAAQFVVSRFWTITELSKLASWKQFWTGSNIFIMFFLLIIGVLITMIRVSGAAHAYGNFVIQRLKSAREAECSSLVLSMLFFIDDYFSCLTVGSVMQPITDRFRVPRAKLALLVSIIAAPLALVVPMTSWVAEITGQLRNAGVGLQNTGSAVILADPLQLYIMSIPYMMYALIVIISLWYMVLNGLSFGIVAQQEDQAKRDGNLFGGKVPVAKSVDRPQSEKVAKSTLRDFVFPMVSLFVSIFVWIAWMGNWRGIGGTLSILDAIQQANIFAGLFVGGLVTIVFTFFFLWHRGTLTLKEVPIIIKDGIRVMGGSIIMLILIWSFSSMLSQDLKTGHYVATRLLGAINVQYLPVLFFVIAALTSVLIGTAWGTLGMLIPLALHMVPTFLGLQVPFDLHDARMVIPVLGAIISGSIVGNHISPIADVMLMTAMSTGAYHLDVVKSMMSFSVPAVISSCCAYLFVGHFIQAHGLLSTALVSLLLGVVINIFLLYCMQVVFRFIRR